MPGFDYKNYKQWVNEWINSQPRGGHGQLRQMALFVGVNSVVMSQIFRGNRDLSLEQALQLAKYMGMTELERDYFLLLVQKDRAGNHELETVLEKQLTKIRSKAQTLQNRIKHQNFADEDKATFYSRWYYSAIRLGISIPRFASVGEITHRLGLERSLVANVVAFLLKHKLIVEKESRLDIGPSVTHVGHDSPLITRHHTNWRLKSLQAMDKNDSSNLFYSGPMALSEDAASEIRNLIVSLLEKTTSKASASQSEVLRCLNIDWFEI